MCDNLHSSGRKNGKFIRIIAYGSEIYEYIQAKKEDEKRMARKGCPRNAVCVLLGRLRRLRFIFLWGMKRNMYAKNEFVVCVDEKGCRLQSLWYIH